MSLAKSLDRLYQTHRQQFFDCALCVVKCPSYAEDAIHDAFLKLFALQGKPADLKSYAFRAVHNAALNIVRRRTRLAEEGLEAAVEPCVEAPDHAGDDESLTQLKSALATLGEDERQVLLLHLQSGLRFREIAVVLDSPVGTVASWYRRGLHRLRLKLERENGPTRTFIAENAPAGSQPQP